MEKKDKIKIVVGVVILVVAIIGFSINHYTQLNRKQVQANTDSQTNTDSSNTDTSDISNTDTDNTGTDDTSTDLNTDADTSTDTSTTDETTTPSTSGKLTSADGNLELESNDWSSDGNVTGVIKNLSGNSYGYVEVDINLYDSNGNQVDSTMTNITNLDAYGTWNFSAPVINPQAGETFKVVSIQGN